MPASRVVFVHGAGHPKTTWPIQSAISGAVFVERFGFSDSVQPQPTSFERDAALVVEAAKPAGHVVAHSFGGIAALHAAAAPNSPVASLVGHRAQDSSRFNELLDGFWERAE
jgi:pimeloyl-ACP methyl ester carboxylesterase